MRSTLAIAALFLAGSAQAATFYLEADGSGDFPTIQEAFDAASPFDEIVLRPGVYHEFDIEASPQVTIRGEGGPESVLLDASGGDIGIFSEFDLGPRVIEGISFRGAAITALSLAGGGTQRISDCVVYDCGVGMYLRDMNGLVERCTVVGGHTRTGTSGSGFSLTGSGPRMVNCIVAFNEGCGVIRWDSGNDPQTFCNDVYENGGGNYCLFPDPTGTFSNISVDPLFCSAGSGDLSVAFTSPCTPDNSPCGNQIGALGPSCVSSLGACCDEETGQCFFITEAICAAGGTRYTHMPGVSCEPNPCPQPSGACCLGDGSCQMLNEDDCVLADGDFQGYDEPCDPNPCSVAGVEGGPGVATWIGSPHPNPSSGYTDLEFRISDPTHLVIEVFDASGRHVSRVLEDDLPAGAHRMTWNGTDDGGRKVGSGVYYLRITTVGGVESRQIQIIR